MNIRTVQRIAVSIYAILMIAMLAPPFYLSFNISKLSIFGFPIFLIYLLVITATMTLSLFVLYFLEGRNADIPY